MNVEYTDRTEPILVDAPQIKAEAIPAPWECPRCGKINAPWANQCSCLPSSDKYYDPAPWPFPYPRPWSPPGTGDPLPWRGGQTGDLPPHQQPWIGDPLDDPIATTSNDKYDIRASECRWNGLFGPFFEK